MKKSLLALAVGVVATSSAYASLNTQVPHGDKSLQIANPSGANGGLCYLPTHLSGAAFSDKDLKSEGELCGIDSYTNAAVCPKDNSTNPGLNFYTVADGSTIQKEESADCKGQNEKFEAKYKLSTSCSYTPAILAYYHISRILGDVCNVPVSVLRTYPLTEHIELAKRGLSLAPSGQLIAQTWSGLLSQLQAGRSGSGRDTLFTSDYQFSYGALSKKPGNEIFYPEAVRKQKKSTFYGDFFNNGSGEDGRVIAFRDNNPIVHMLSTNADIGTVIGTDFNQANVQKFMQVNDAANMIILDTLLSQQDRQGNVAFIQVAVSRGQDGKLEYNRGISDDQVKQLGAVVVKQMLLKDNDCGVAKDNIALKVLLYQKIAHLNADVYKRLLLLNKNADDPSTKAFFESDLMFTDRDYTTFRTNLKTVTDFLHSACASNRLRLDLDIDAHFSKQVLHNSCNI